MKINKKISIAFLVLTVMITCIIASVFYVISRKNLVNKTFAHLQTTAQSRASHLESFFEEAKVRMRIIAGSDTLEKATSAVVRDGSVSKELMGELSSVLKNFLENEKEAFEIFILNPDGKVIGSTNDKSIGADKSSDMYFSEGMKDTHIMDAFYSETLERRLYAISTPITNDRTGKVLGVLESFFDTANVDKIVADRTGMGETSDIYIVNKDGFMITPSIFKTDTFLNQKVDTENTREAFEDYIKYISDTGKIKEHEEKHFVYESYNGVRVVGTHAYIPELNWILVVEINIKEVFAPLYQLRNVFIVLMILIPLIVWLAGSTVSSRITRPIYKLQEGVEIIGRGDLDYRVKIDTNDEVGMLAGTFNKMAQSLKHSTISIAELNNEILERKSAEDKLKESEQRIRSIFDNVTDGILVTDIEHNRFHSGNKKICEMLGYTWEEMENLGVMDIHPEEDYPYIEEQFKRQLKGEITLAKDIQVKRKDGSVFYADINASVVKIEDKKYLLGIFRDLTEHRETEEALRRSSEFARTILDSIRDAICIINAKDFRISECNREFEEQFGSGEDVIGKTCYEVTHKKSVPCSPPNDTCPLNEVLENKKHSKVEHVHFNRAGEKVFVEVSAFPIQDSKGEITEIVHLARDISERRKYESKLHDAYKKLKETQEQLIQTGKMVAMGQLAAGISHELNQPLTGIKGFAQAALMEIKDDGPLKKDLNKIVQQADRMDKIIQHVRFFSRKSDFYIRELDIKEPIEEALSLLNEQLRVHNIRLKKSMPFDLPRIQGDPNQLEQVFLNLITNARDAIDSLKSPDGGEIMIKAVESDDRKYMKIIFEDTGKGIAEKDLDSIFNPFFTTKSPDGGIGLGLSIVYRIIESHKGTITADLREKGGSVFTITLPIF